jgi:hypothetical protein
MSTEAAFLSLLFTGIAALVAGVGLTRLHWRPDTPPYGRRTPSLQVMLHPERYTKDAPLRAIRTLNVAGGLLLAGAACITGYEILRAIL